MRHEGRGDVSSRRGERRLLLIDELARVEEREAKLGDGAVDVSVCRHGVEVAVSVLARHGDVTVVTIA